MRNIVWSKIVPKPAGHNVDDISGSVVCAVFRNTVERRRMGPHVVVQHHIKRK